MLAVSSLDIIATMGGLFAALGISGLLGARWQADRDRQERMRERMIIAADEFVTATMNVASLLQRAAAATSDESRAEHLRQAQSAYQTAYGHVGRLAILFPPHEQGAGVTSAHDPATQVMNSLGRAMRAVAAQAPLDQIQEALGGVGQAQGVFARYVNGFIWSRKLQPSDRLLSRS